MKVFLKEKDNNIEPLQVPLDFMGTRPHIENIEGDLVFFRLNTKVNNFSEEFKNSKVTPMDCDICRAIYSKDEKQMRFKISQLQTYCDPSFYTNGPEQPKPDQRPLFLCYLA
jgi:hypothetical protein